MSAINASFAQKHLEAEGAVVLTVRPVREYSWPGRDRENSLAFARVLSSLLTAGVPLSRALRAARDLATSDFRQVVDDIMHNVANGRTLEAALTSHGRYFGDVPVTIIAAGEQSGSLAGSLQQAVAHMEREAALRARILSASIYPMVLAVAGVMTLGILMIVVLPRFAELIVSSGGSLPRFAAGLVFVGTFVRGHTPALVMACLAVIGLLVTAFRSRTVVTTLARHSFKVPVLGRVRRWTAASQFLRNVGTLTDAGIPLMHAIDRYARSVRDPEIRRLALEARDALRAGRSMKDVIRGMAFIPAVGVQLVCAGESAGYLSSHMLRAAQLLEDDLERYVARCMTLLEPILILLTGLIIGLTALALLQAVYGLHAGAFL